MDVLWAVLPALALLACPLMMVFCFVGMRRMGHGTSDAAVTTGSTAPREARIATLEQQLLALQGELAALRAASADVIDVVVVEAAAPLPAATDPPPGPAAGLPATAGR